jgi:hypothetical protein
MGGEIGVQTDALLHCRPELDEMDGGSEWLEEKEAA